MRPTAALIFIAIVLIARDANAQEGDSAVKSSFFPNNFSLSQPSGINVISKKRVFRFNGGVAEYNFLLRSTVDSLFPAKDLSQHQFSVRAGVVVKDQLPLQVGAFVRRSNSEFLQDITDIQISLDVTELKRTVLVRLQARREDKLRKMYDTASIASYRSLQQSIEKKKTWLNEPANKLQLLQYRELINVPALSSDRKLSDSANHVRYDSIRKEAESFIEKYENVKKELKSLSDASDSLKNEQDLLLSAARDYEKLLRLADGGDRTALRKLRRTPEGEALLADRKQVPMGWIRNVRAFQLGRSNVYTSDLTAKNITINGINFEYNSWFIFGVTAGVLENRFRDFLMSNTPRTPQHMYQVRFGIGSIEGNHVLLSAFGGEKRIYGLNSTGGTPIRTKGLSLGGRWQIAPTVALYAEGAQTFAPDYRSFDTIGKSGNKISESGDRAYAVRLSGGVERHLLNFESYYRYQGANYQAFNRFQTNSEQTEWSVRVKKGFFRNHLRFDAGLSTNDYANPYVMHRYEARNVMKTFTAGFRKRGWPSISLGMQPVSQVTALGDQLFENRFEAITGSATHTYKLGVATATSTLLLSCFQNHLSDSAFALSNADNYFFTNSIFFKSFDLTVSFSRSIAWPTRYMVFENLIRIPFKAAGSLSFGFKINELNGADLKVGQNFELVFPVGKQMVTARVERGFWPGTTSKLTRNNSGSIGIRRTF
ncbi:hypothetical protein EPD60_16715 [Flaviaesturariibacter flavus]|uniref:Uncharacterized protein n=1 Tax=Flaviaesturariibacter flavus TaxID=2502780 RepID=A0A4V2NV59_9BACT|nr:hypothetical protein [Flaviaesturariibacter flavus]TCJ12186.1 hypothetical protein EPD60_16715 [Flaviaesturariibacter flavus]